ncbi:MAG: hypothetical protein ACRD1Z_01755, partial [Vicinamibacteria bacterium]
MDWFQKFNVLNDPFDVAAFKRVFDESPRLQETLDEKQLATAPELGQDVFDSLYKYVPALRKEDEVDATYHFNRALLEKAMGTPEYERLRASTQLDETSSAIATEVISEELLKNLPEEDRKAVNDHTKTRADLTNALSKLKALEELGKQQKLSAGLKGTQTKLQQALPALQQAHQAAQPAFGQACQSPQAKAVFRAAVNTALQQVQYANDFLGGGWGLEGGNAQKLNAKDRMELMKHILKSEKIRKLNRLLGRLKRLALHKRYTRVTSEPDEVTDVTLSNDLARVLPSELVYLADPETEILFYEKFATRKLLTYEMQGKETVGRGPILIYNDTSGSMSVGVDGMTAELWSKGVTLAMADIALKDRRTIGVGNFGSRGEMQYVEIPHTLPPAERLRRLIAAAETFFGGGTNFETPLDHALAEV